MYRMVDCSTWDDDWFSELPPEGKLLFLNLLTNNRSTPAGAFQVTVRTMAHETGLSADRVTELLSSFGDRVTYWPEHAIVWVKNFYRRQRPNDKFTIGARQIVAKLPPAVRDRICQEYPELLDATETPPPPTDTHGIPTVTGMDTHLLRVEESSKALEDEKRETGAKAPAAADAAPPESPPRPLHGPPKTTKPRTAKQLTADAAYERQKALYDAYCRGVGIDLDGFEYENRRSRAFGELKPALKADEFGPDVMERLSHYAAIAYRWRDGKRIPFVSEVLLAFQEWENDGRPDEPVPKQPARASPNRSRSEEARSNVEYFQAVGRGEIRLER